MCSSEARKGLRLAHTCKKAPGTANLPKPFLLWFWVTCTSSSVCSTSVTTNTSSPRLRSCCRILCSGCRRHLQRDCWGLPTIDSILPTTPMTGAMERLRSPGGLWIPDFPRMFPTVSRRLWEYDKVKQAAGDPCACGETLFFTIHKSKFTFLP